LHHVDSFDTLAMTVSLIKKVFNRTPVMVPALRRRPSYYLSVLAKDLALL